MEGGERRYQELEQRYKRFVSDIQDKLRRLTADRHMVQQELHRSVMARSGQVRLGHVRKSRDMN